MHHRSNNKEAFGLEKLMPLTRSLRIQNIVRASPMPCPWRHTLTVHISSNQHNLQQWWAQIRFFQLITNFIRHRGCWEFMTWWGIIWHKQCGVRMWAIIPHTLDRLFLWALCYGKCPRSFQNLEKSPSILYWWFFCQNMQVSLVYEIMACIPCNFPHSMAGLM